MSKYKVSFYTSQKNVPTVKNTKKSIEVDLFDVLNDIKAGTYKNEILQLRSLDEAEYKKQKVSLPGFTPSGAFTERKFQGLTNHTGVICIDFDNLENAIDIRDSLSLDKWVLSVFISPSGNGVKALVLMDASRHLETFKALADHYEKEIGQRIDEACKDVSRLCFVSYDPGLFINEEAIMFSLPDKEIKAKVIDEVLHEVETITQRIEKANKDITNDYKDWLKLGFSLASVLNESGRQYFDRLSKFSAKYSPETTKMQYDECLKDRKGGITIKTFFYLAKANGIDTIIEDSPSPRNTSISKYTQPLKQGEISERARLENLVSDAFETRFNVILNRVECKNKDEGEESSQWEEANEHDISRHIELNTNRNCSPNRIKSMLMSNFVGKFNPFRTYFESLPTYDQHKEPDYIQNLCSIVQLKDEAGDRDRFNKHFKKALVRCIACSISEDKNNLNYNKHAIIFISPKQSIGKSGFIRFLIPKDLELYFTEKMTFGNREEDFTMQSSFIINLDEMAQIDEKNLASVKSAMSKGNLNFRDMNVSRRINSPRRSTVYTHLYDYL